MAEGKRVLLETALQNNMEQLDRQYFRKILKAAYECSAKCCESSETPENEVQHCVNTCDEILNDTRTFITSEVQRYQARIQRCVSECNDEARDVLGPSPSKAQVKKASKMFDNCASQCGDKHISTLPQFMMKVKEVLEKKVADSTGKIVKGTTI